MSFISRRGLLSASAAVSVTACASAPAVAPPAPLPQGWTLDATEMALRIRRGELSAVEAVEAAIGRVQRLQPVLNVIVNSSFEQALDRARAGSLSGPFAGAPFLVKDLYDAPGLPTRDGSASTLGLAAATRMDATVLAFQRAGLVSLGKSATPEHGFLPTTEPLVFGPTRNPWDLSRSAGGSSGGAAAAVAAGIVPVAHASDGGGSIRIPASCCGLFGLKPSRGRTVQEEPARTVTDLGVEHVVSHSVRDSAAILSLTELPGPHTPVGYVTDPSERRLRVGLVIDTATGVTPDLEVTAAIESTAALMTDLGHTVEPTDWPIDGDRFAEDFLTLWAMGAAQVLKDAGNPTLLEPFTVGLARMLATLPARRTEGLVERLETVARQYNGWFANFDVILSPVLAKPPVPLGHLRGDLPFDELRERLTAYVGYTPLHNVAGAPAMSVPLTWTPAGLPVGSHFAARVGDERTLLELAYELEQARPWAGRRPPVHAG